MSTSLPQLYGEYIHFVKPYRMYVSRNDIHGAEALRHTVLHKIVHSNATVKTKDQASRIFEYLLAHTEFESADVVFGQIRVENPAVARGFSYVTIDSKTALSKLKKQLL